MCTPAQVTPRSTTAEQNNELSFLHGFEASQNRSSRTSSVGAAAFMVTLEVLEQSRVHEGQHPDFAICRTSSPINASKSSTWWVSKLWRSGGLLRNVFVVPLPQLHVHRGPADGSSESYGDAASPLMPGLFSAPRRPAAVSSYSQSSLKTSSVKGGKSSAYGCWMYIDAEGWLTVLG